MFDKFIFHYNKSLSTFYTYLSAMFYIWITNYKIFLFGVKISFLLFSSIFHWKIKSQKWNTQGVVQCNPIGLDVLTVFNWKQQQNAICKCKASGMFAPNRAGRAVRCDESRERAAVFTSCAKMPRGPVYAMRGGCCCCCRSVVVARSQSMWMKH